MGVNNSALPAEMGLWSKFKGFFLQEINVELTPFQQKIEDDLNRVLSQEVTWQGIKNFLFQEIRF